MIDQDELTRRLYLLREQMEQLLCALDIQQLLLEQKQLRWLPRVSENVETIVEDIRESEAERIVVSRRVAVGMGLGEDASLSQLIDAADGERAALWRRCRHQLVALQTEIEAGSQRSREMTTDGLLVTKQVLRTMETTDDADTYDQSGSTTHFSSSARRFDRTG